MAPSDWLKASEEGRLFEVRNRFFFGSCVLIGQCVGGVGEVIRRPGDSHGGSGDWQQMEMKATVISKSFLMKSTVQ